LFVSELGGPPTPVAVRKLMARAGERVIQQYQGHRNITHTVRYTELRPERLKGF